MMSNLLGKILIIKSKMSNNECLRYGKDLNELEEAIRELEGNIEILKDKLDFHFDNQKQTVNIRHNHRIVPGKGITLSLDDEEEFNKLKKIFKNE